MLTLAGLAVGASRGIDSGFVVPIAAPLAGGAPIDETVVADGDVAHAVSVVETPGGDLQAFWYQGEREAAPDVRIFSSIRSNDRWSAPRLVSDPASTAAEVGRFVRFLGNATVFRHADGEYWMVYVSVSIGGWSGAELNLKRSSDGVHWGPAKRLIVSPVFNRARLVRAPPIALRDGRIVLPVYDEMVAGFSDLLVLDRDGDVVDRIRIAAGGRQATQPWLIVLDERRAVAFMRTVDDSRTTVWRSETRDGGLTWSPLQATALINPNSAVAATRLADGRILLVGNISALRTSLHSAALSSDEGLTWTVPVPLLDGAAERHGFRYPWLMNYRGQIHLFLSEYLPRNISRSIRHVVVGPSVLTTEDAR